MIDAIIYPIESKKGPNLNILKTNIPKIVIGAKIQYVNPKYLSLKF